MKRKLEILWDKMRREFRRALKEEKELISKFYAQYDVIEREDTETAQLAH
jgi:hypothetical protein